MLVENNKKRSKIVSIEISQLENRDFYSKINGQFVAKVFYRPDTASLYMKVLLLKMNMQIFVI